jgi:hypothetical protein
MYAGSTPLRGVRKVLGESERMSFHGRMGLPRRCVLLLWPLVAALACTPAPGLTDAEPGDGSPADGADVPGDGPPADGGPAMVRPTGAPEVVLSDLDLYLNAVTGAGQELWIAGGIRGDGQLLHHDGQRWSRWHLGPDLLWAVAVAPDGSVLVVGENGAGYRRQGGAWSRIEPVTTGYLYSVVASPGGVVRAAGGSPSASPGFEDQVLLRLSPGGWEPEDPGLEAAGSPDEAVTFRTLWGRADDDLYLGGEHGVLCHFDGTRWRQLETPTRDPLRSIFGDGDRLLALTAGEEFGFILGRDSAAGPFLIHVAERALELRGGVAHPGHEPLVVASGGYAGSVSLDDGLHPLPRVTEVDLTGVHVDAEGSYTLVGGNLRALIPGGPLGAVLRLGAPLAGGPIEDRGDAL